MRHTLRHTLVSQYGNGIALMFKEAFPERTTKPTGLRASAMKFEPDICSSRNGENYPARNGLLIFLRSAIGVLRRRCSGSSKVMKCLAAYAFGTTPSTTFRWDGSFGFAQHPPHILALPRPMAAMPVRDTSTKLGKRHIFLTLDATLIFSGSAKFIAESNVN